LECFFFLFFLKKKKSFQKGYTLGILGHSLEFNKKILIDK